MQRQLETNSASPAAGPREPQRYAAARTAGALLLLTAIATVVSVVTRVASGADQPTLLESLAAIAANKELYSVSGGRPFRIWDYVNRRGGLRVEDMGRRWSMVRAYSSGHYDCIWHILPPCPECAPLDWPFQRKA